jgi:segregation and condensation protein B
MMKEKTAIVEALIFAAETPLTIEKIRKIFPDLTHSDAVCFVQELMQEYNKRQGGICIQEVAGGFRFQTRIEMAPWIGKLKAVRPLSLSPSAMETLAVVAYRQPVVKADIDRIRGVDTGGALKGLMEKKLLRIVGRKDVPGKPIIYGTTGKFLEVFNLKNLAELPTLREMKDLQPTDLQDHSDQGFSERPEKAR